MSSRATRATQEERFVRVLETCPDITGLFRDLDPYSEDYGGSLAAVSNAAVDGLFTKLSDAIPGLAPVAMLRNAWSVAASKPHWLALLHRMAVVSGQPELQAEAARLVVVSKASLAGDAAARALIGCDQPGLQMPPDLCDKTRLKPGLRLRYTLAHHWAAGAGAGELLRVALEQPNSNTYLRCRELARAMRAGHALRPRVARLTRDEVQILRADLQRLLRESRELQGLMLPAEIADAADVEAELDGLFEELSRKRAALERLDASLRGRAFEAAASQLENLVPDIVTRHLAGSILYGVALRNGEAQAGVLEPWRPLPPASVKRLSGLMPRLQVPAYWSMSAEEIAHRVAAGTLALAEVAESDIPRIQRQWTAAEHDLLAAAGRFDALPIEAAAWGRLTLPELLRAGLANGAAQPLVAARLKALPDARPVLALLSASDGAAIKKLAIECLGLWGGFTGENRWIDWVIPSIGSAEWHTNAPLADEGGKILPAALAFLKEGGKPVDRDGFTAEIVAMLAGKRGSGTVRNELIRTFLAIDPKALNAIASALTNDRLRTLLADPETSLALLARFKKVVSEEMRDVIWHNRLARVRTAKTLREALRERAQSGGAIRWDDKWLKLGGSPVDRGVALILASRHNIKRFRSVVCAMDEQLLDQALKGAVADLPPTARRDQGFLELVGALGTAHIPYLSAVMTMADRNAGPGHKLDAAYQQYLLPKKSGGSRVISAPHRHLKRIQRAVLDRLIQPLGSHESAYGFVPGRSIKHNAQVHVGQPIVTNADVSNCFPSVKWPLVLGALRRDLGGVLGAGAISLLVDICTADGGLPIGAPTSPALLNRVLMRTDQVLQAAAARLQCRYTRYADDLTFSGDHGAVRLLGVAERTLSQIGLALDPKKTNIYRPGRRQIVTGLVVNKRVSVPRRLRRRIRAAVHAVEQGRNPHWHDQEEPLTSLQGRLSFLNGIEPEHALRLVERLAAANRPKKKARR